MELACHHLTKTFPTGTVLNDVTFRIDKGEKTALIGNNGAGKTTLLKLITGEMQPDEGTVALSRDITVGYLRQNQGLSSSLSVYEEVLLSKKNLVDMEAKITRMEQAMAANAVPDMTAAAEEYHLLLAEFERLGGYTYRSEIQGVLKGLGFLNDDFDRKISTLSGGQKTRVAMAGILLREPSLLILDEPTNHLDIESIRFLENFLINYKHSLLLVSHDRYFLDRIVRRVLELENGRLYSYSGGYSDYVSRKKARIEEETKAYLNNQAEIRHQEEVIAKLKSFNREKSIKRAESREKMLSRMEVVEKPVVFNAEMKLTFRPAIRSGNDVLHVENLAKAYPGQILFNGLSFDIKRGEHVALIGSNGTGKTTLLKILNRHVSPDSGFFRFGTNVHPGYYDQEQQLFNEDNTVFEEISDLFPDMNNTRIRTLLASFLFFGEDVFKQIRDLSGGERGRLSLARLMLGGNNLLFLDEPTNHLDILSKTVLENALNQYEGTVLYVSHDRYFVNQTASRILELKDGYLNDSGPSMLPDAPEKYHGNYDYYMEKTASAGKSDAGAPRDGLSEAPSASRLDWQQQKEAQARKRKQENDLKRCEKQIGELEDRLNSLQEELASPENQKDLEKLQSVSLSIEKTESELTSLYDLWESLAQ